MTTDQRRKVFERVEEIVRTKYFDPQFNGRNWPELVQQHRANILTASDDHSFEGAVNTLLESLGTSHTHFFSPQTKVPSRNSVNATFRAIATESGRRWVFCQDVQPGGPADVSGIKPGDVLLAVDDAEILPPTTPSFHMNSSMAVAVIRRNGATRRINVKVATPRPKYY